MCLWYCHYCPWCESITPLTHPLPILCNNPLCRRLTIRFPAATQMPINMLADEPCHASCNSEYCGLLVRFAFCGEADSTRAKCQQDPPPSPSSSSLTSSSSDDDDDADAAAAKNNKTSNNSEYNLDAATVPATLV